MSEAGGNLLDDMKISPELVILDLEAESDQEAIEKLASRFLEMGIVKESFLPAIQQREREYCTGLQFEEMGVAVPHTMPEHVNEAAVGIATLKKPVAFRAMGMPDDQVPVELVFMLAIRKAHDQLEFLQALMTAFQRPGTLPELKGCKSPEELVERFRKDLCAAAPA